MKQILYLTIFIALNCTPNKNINLGKSETYLPNQSLLKNGLVWKYYVHHIDNKTSTTTTDIKYLKMKLIADKHISIDVYNAGFQCKTHKDIVIENDQWKITNQYYLLSNGDTIPYHFQQNVMIDWNSNNSKTNYSSKFKNFTFNNIENQISIADTIVDNKKSKIIYIDKTSQFIRNTDTTFSKHHIAHIWSEGMGIKSIVSKDKKITYKWELVEIMKTNEFEKRANHGTHRVGYIDSTHVLDQNSTFELCEPQNQIADYYNDDMAGFEGGKGRLKALISKELNPKLLKNESGYLTYRFVINCKGQAGWFITEEADLTFTPKSFHKTTVDHIFQILRDVKSWKPLYIKSKERDSYYYITFKLKNGKIIEILP